MKYKKQSVAALIAIAAMALCGLVLVVTCAGNGGKDMAVKSAKEALLASVEYPDSVRIIAVSKPDSVFGREYVTDEEKLNLAMTMMKVNDYMMSRTDSLEKIDINDTALNDLMMRQMNASNSVRSLMHSGVIKSQQNQFTGYKVKIEFECVSEYGNRYHSEYWFITDRSGRHVINAYEIPVL